jgi:hypothetical protein
MKKSIIQTSLIIALAIASSVTLLALSGCSTLDRALLTSTQTITPAITNAVIVENTNADGTITPVAELVVTPSQTNTIFAPNTTATTGLTILSAVPVPWCGTAAAILTAALSMYVSGRNKKLAAALVTGIEAGRQILQTTPEGQKLDAKIKDALIAHQEAAGVLNAASQLVNSLTGNTVQQGA